MHKLVNDLFSKSVPCSTSMTQRQPPPGANCLLSPEAHLEDAAHKSLSSKPLPSSALDCSPVPHPRLPDYGTSDTRSGGLPPLWAALPTDVWARGGEPLGGAQALRDWGTRTSQGGWARGFQLKGIQPWHLQWAATGANPRYRNGRVSPGVGAGHAEASSGPEAPLFLNSCLYLPGRV